MVDKDNEYTKMQLNQYDREAHEWTIDNNWKVVGSNHDDLNNYNDFNLMFEKFENLDKQIVLDFGCGPGRNLVKYYHSFSRLDGCDISNVNLEKAREWLSYHKLDSTVLNLYQTDGISLRPIPSESYDLIMSTITMQHISVYDIRYSIFSDMFRVLKSGGWITIQMGYGSKRQGAVEYYENSYNAPGTNGMCDVKVTDSQQLENDLIKIGFRNFSYEIRDCHPLDLHSNWIYFRAQK